MDSPQESKEATPQDSASVEKESSPKQPKDQAPTSESPYRFPPLDNIGSHFYDNEAGTFWLGVNLRGDPLALPLLCDAAKLPLVQAMLDFRAKEARKASLVHRVKEAASDLKESITEMMGRMKAKSATTLH